MFYFFESYMFPRAFGDSLIDGTEDKKLDLILEQQK